MIFSAFCFLLYAWRKAAVMINVISSRIVAKRAWKYLFVLLWVLAHNLFDIRLIVRNLRLKYSVGLEIIFHGLCFQLDQMSKKLQKDKYSRRTWVLWWVVMSRYSSESVFHVDRALNCMIYGTRMISIHFRFQFHSNSSNLYVEWTLITLKYTFFGSLRLLHLENPTQILPEMLVGLSQFMVIMRFCPLNFMYWSIFPSVRRPIPRFSFERPRSSILPDGRLESS